MGAPEFMTPMNKMCTLKNWVHKKRSKPGAYLRKDNGEQLPIFLAHATSTCKEQNKVNF